MTIETHQITLEKRLFTVDVQRFSAADKPHFLSLYNRWRDLSNDLSALGGRRVNLPEVLSEGAFCIEMDTVRFVRSVAGAKSSFDCFDLARNTRIQVKASSVAEDLTTFGPNSVWDELYFLDFYRHGNYDGTFDIYLIPNHFIYNQPVNSSQTFSQQQAQVRRPRFSIIKEIIRPNHLSPVMTGNLNP